VDIRFSRRAEHVKPSAIRNKLFDSPDIISFSAGKPDASFFPAGELVPLAEKVLAENGMTLKDYIVGLIGNDLKDSKPLSFENISLDSMISEESVKEAQKVLDFVRGLLASFENVK
jgi:hypothetical protein